MPEPHDRAQHQGVDHEIHAIECPASGASDEGAAFGRSHAAEEGEQPGILFGSNGRGNGTDSFLADKLKKIFLQEKSLFASFSSEKRCFF
jgi:hypothetical protein